MKITLKCDTETHNSIDFILTNEEMNTDGLVEIVVDGKDYMVNVTDLFDAMTVFQRIKERNKEV